MTTPEVVAAVTDELWDDLEQEFPQGRPQDKRDRPARQESRRPWYDPTLYSEDGWLKIADYARERFAAGDTLADNPYAPGTREFFEFGGAMLDQMYDRR